MSRRKKRGKTEGREERGKWKESLLALAEKERTREEEYEHELQSGVKPQS